MTLEHTGYDNGTIIGERYRIVGLIGQGGMGEVYAVEDLRLQGKLRALKVNRGTVKDGVYSAEEAGLLMRLNHPHLPLITDYFSANEAGHEILIMDYIDGLTLKSHLSENGGVMQLSAVLEIGIQLCDALGYLHAQHPPIIHRDLKPTNVMMERSGFVRLIDFGIARRYKRGQSQDTVSLGTPGFAAPEQEGQQQSDARTDVFGLGALLYYLLSGGSLRMNSAAAPTRLLPHLPAPFNAVLARMVDPLPEFRYSSMEETKLALANCLVQFQGYSAALAASAPMAKKQQRIVVASLSAGSGATFVSITLLHLLGLRGIDCAGVEHPELEPEWNALLNLSEQASAESRRPLDSRYRRSALPTLPITWHALHPFHSRDDAEQALKYRLMMDSLQQSIVVTDLSSKWTSKEVENEVLQADVLLFVVDPFPAKWSLQRMKAVQSICFERNKHHRSTLWIANKDQRFQTRVEWLAMIPAKPILTIPMLPSEEWVDQMWEGKWATAHKRWLPTLERAFQPIFDKVFA
ncbi:hypothetical protein Back11_12460 [Paenibacillus baekrokdamisoli]|uniref:Protein kinase domain-containing protein n=2 Tax=Paenibacillus baekrokdamisoli TaxID=1712516 RepID=A0A3G9J232_9BACL|nr:serine/threonine-protein kinase [Paenibacillus baekrokdamisoli]BBH19901.1 hypothetical protein Back11_12460 [Paenibacillus baekrokdamisoli]